MNFIKNGTKFLKSKMQIIAHITLNYALNLNVICFSFCNNMQILISVVFFKLHRSRPVQLSVIR